MDKETVDRLGYDLEGLYFERVNRELLQKLREKLDRERLAAAIKNATTVHWMRCPKCGSALEELAIQSLKLDRCSSCQGVFFDAGELAILLQTDDESFVADLRKFLRAGESPRLP